MKKLLNIIGILATIGSTNAQCDLNPKDTKKIHASRTDTVYNKNHQAIEIKRYDDKDKLIVYDACNDLGYCDMVRAFFKEDKTIQRFYKNGKPLKKEGKIFEYTHNKIGVIKTYFSLEDYPKN